jgi:hypothetical protein
VVGGWLRWPFSGGLTPGSGVPSPRQRAGLDTLGSLSDLWQLVCLVEAPLLRRCRCPPMRLGTQRMVGRVPGDIILCKGW